MKDRELLGIMSAIILAGKDAIDSEMAVTSASTLLKTIDRTIAPMTDENYVLFLAQRLTAKGIRKINVGDLKREDSLAEKRCKRPWTNRLRLSLCLDRLEKEGKMLLVQRGCWDSQDGQTRQARNRLYILCPIFA